MPRWFREMLVLGGWYVPWNTRTAVGTECDFVVGMRSRNWLFYVGQLALWVRLWEIPLLCLIVRRIVPPDHRDTPFRLIVFASRKSVPVLSSSRSLFNQRSCKSGPGFNELLFRPVEPITRKPFKGEWHKQPDGRIERRARWRRLCSSQKRCVVWHKTWS